MCFDFVKNIVNIRHLNGEDTLCLICGKRLAAYEKVRHCKICHSKYVKANYRKHCLQKGENNDRFNGR